MIKWNTRTQATESDYHTLLGKHSLHFLHIEFLGMSRWEVKIWTVSGIYTVPLPLLECSKLLGEKKLSSHTNAIASAQLNGHISTMLMHPHSIHSTCMLSPVHDRHWDLKLPYLCLFRLKDGFGNTTAEETSARAPRTRTHTHAHTRTHAQAN